MHSQNNKREEAGFHLRRASQSQIWAVVLCIAVGVVGCKKKEEEKQPAPPPDREGLFSYSIQNDACNSGMHTDYTLADHCRTLMLDDNNGDCPKDLRQTLFDKRCGGYPFSHEVAKAQLETPGLVSSCVITEGNPSAADVDERLAKRAGRKTTAKKFSVGYRDYVAHIEQVLNNGRIDIRIRIANASGDTVISNENGKSGSIRPLKSEKPSQITKLEGDNVRVVCQSTIN